MSLTDKRLLACGMGACAIAVFAAALSFEEKKPLRPQVIECHSMTGTTVKAHTEDVVTIETHGYSSVARNGVRYYFSPSLDMTCVTHDEAPDI